MVWFDDEPPEAFEDKTLSPNPFPKSEVNQVMSALTKTRAIGYNLQRRMEDLGCTTEEAASASNCTPEFLKRFFFGRGILSYGDFCRLCSFLKIAIRDALEPDMTEYDRHYTHNCGEFTNLGHREEVLDIINDYLDLLEVTL